MWNDKTRLFARTGLLFLFLSPGAGGLSAAEDKDMVHIKELGRIREKSLKEISGMAASFRNPNVLWIHEDGDIRAIHAVRTSGEIVARLRLPGKLTDVEDIAIGPGPSADTDYIYLADIGDNDRQRRFVRVIRFIEPDLSADADGELDEGQTEQFRMTYPDGPVDAEALLVDPVTRGLLIATKEKSTSRVFLARADQLTTTDVIPLTQLCAPMVRDVSAGDISRDGRRVVLRTEERGWLWERAANQSLVDVLRGQPKPLVVLGENQARNGEAIALHPSGRAYFTISEGTREPIYVFRIP
jgi:hypothetical protein